MGGWRRRARIGHVRLELFSNETGEMKLLLRHSLKKALVSAVDHSQSLQSSGNGAICVGGQ